MGQQVSKDIRSRLEHCTLEELLTDDKCIEELQRYLPALPERSHTNLAKVFASWENMLSEGRSSGSQPNPPPEGRNSSPKDRNSGTSRLGSLWSIQSKDISIPKSVAEALKQDYCNKLRQSSKNGVDLQSPADHYEYTCAVETDRTLGRILWRFLTTFYYDLISELDTTKQRLSATQNGGLAFVVAVICQSGKHNPEIVREKVVGWTKAGRRYRGFMDALCAGCLILFPEQISDLVWEKYVPIKGDMFAKVIQFLQDLGMVDKCEEEGWNDLSDKILQTLREPFRCLIAFQFQPGQQSQIGWAANSSLAPVPGDAGKHRPERSMLSRDRVEEMQNMDIDNSLASRTLHSRALPTPVANRVTKTKRKKGTTSVRRQLQSFARDLVAHETPRPEKSLPLVVRQSNHASRAHMSEMQHETHERDPQGLFPRAQTHCWASAPNDPGQRHLATNHQDSRLLSSQVSINDRGRDPLSDITLNAMNTHDADQQQRTGESISDTFRFERTNFGTISALLNHDNNNPTTTFAATQDSLQGAEDGCTEPVSGIAGQQSSDTLAACSTQTELYLDSVPQQSDAASAGVATRLPRAIQFGKRLLEQIVANTPIDILGEIWFGNPQGFSPFVSLRLPEALGSIIQPLGREVFIPTPSPEAKKIFNGLYSIKPECFKVLIQRDGFGDICWNETKGEGFVSIDVIDKKLILDFINACKVGCCFKDQ